MHGSMKSEEISSILSNFHLVCDRTFQFRHSAIEEDKPSIHMERWDHPAGLLENPKEVSFKGT